MLSHDDSAKMLVGATMFLWRRKYLLHLIPCAHKKRKAGGEVCVHCVPVSVCMYVHVCSCVCVMWRNFLFFFKVSKNIYYNAFPFLLVKWLSRIPSLLQTLKEYSLLYFTFYQIQ